jgi:hypothetical protein
VWQVKKVALETFQPDSPAAQGGRGLKILFLRVLTFQLDSPAAQGGRDLENHDIFSGVSSFPYFLNSITITR